MEAGAILPLVSIAVLQPAAPAGTQQQSIAVTTIPLARGASILIRSIDVRKPAPAAVRRLMTMPITAIPMARGQARTIHSTSAQKRALLVEIPARNMRTMSTRTATANATTVAQPSV